MSGASWALQKAIFTTLSQDAALMARGTAVHDAAPQDAPFPYIAIGEDIVSDASAKDMTATDHRLALHVWTRGPGKGEAKMLLQAAQDALHISPPQPSGYRLVFLLYLQSTVLTDPDGLTQHGVIELRGRLCPL